MASWQRAANFFRIDNSESCKDNEKLNIILTEVNILISLFGARDVENTELINSKQEFDFNNLYELKSQIASMINDAAPDNPGKIPVRTVNKDVNESSKIINCVSVRKFFDEITTPDFKAFLSAKIEYIKRINLSLVKLERNLTLEMDILNDHMIEKAPQSRLISDLWIIVSFFVLSGLGAMAIVRLFPQDVQMEWVASGQVTQFVTILILFSAVIAFGLTGVLPENVIGTLIGGIAGYVLSQGVGKSVANDFRRRFTDSPKPPNPGAQQGGGSAQPGDGSAQPGDGSAQPSSGSVQPGNGSAQPNKGSGRWRFWRRFANR